VFVVFGQRVQKRETGGIRSERDLRVDLEGSELDPGISVFHLIQVFSLSS